MPHVSVIDEAKKDRDALRDTHRELQTLMSFPIVGDTPAKVFIFKKAERLSVALHLVTNHIKDTEPAKSEVRKSALEIVRGVSQLTRSGPTDRNDIIAAIAEASLRTFASISALAEVGMVSSGNATLVKREIAFLLQLADGHVGISQDSGSIDESIFDVPSVVDNATKRANTVQRNIRNRSKEATHSEATFDSEKGAEITKMREGVSRIGHIGHNGQTTEVSDIKDSSSDFSSRNAVSDERSHAIINLLKTKSNLSVKDFLAVVPGVSEKTIQRELILLCEKRILSKTGARRWTRYSLAQ